MSERIITTTGRYTRFIEDGYEVYRSRSTFGGTVVELLTALRFAWKSKSLDFHDASLNWGIMREAARYFDVPLLALLEVYEGEVVGNARTGQPLYERLAPLNLAHDYFLLARCGRETQVLVLMGLYKGERQ